MEAKEIYNQIIEKFKDFTLPPLMLAIFEEMSEHAANSEVSDDEKAAVALIAYRASVTPMMAVIETALKNTNVVTINYRGRTFELTPESSFVKMFSEPLR